MKCTFLHPQMCRNSVTNQKCFNEKCRFVHRKGTQRRHEAEQLPPPTKGSQGYETHFPEIKTDSAQHYQQRHWADATQQPQPRQWADTTQQPQPKQWADANQQPQQRQWADQTNKQNAPNAETTPNSNHFLGVLQQIQQQLYSLQIAQQNQAATIQRLSSATPAQMQHQQMEYPTTTTATTMNPTTGQIYLQPQM